ncbi:DUF6488 family protein [Saccharospirillum salsuginis]|uniref:Peptidase propeptide and YPEB domain-containing protein n=1 Tax=Saccharospirillum salsuginis TaxID=418750 RepID=A0A918K0Z2_9GAMM|nr:DUF6488 family protein [Saccharospirillum salsuginis]GGX43100.1 hypothetical protein GCM10007392_07250 [Saccharospirillum salsuginis]
MSTLIKGIALTFTLLFLSSAWAHTDHGPKEPLSQDTIVERANQAVEQLVSNDRIPSSWQGAYEPDVTRQDSQFGLIWSVLYQNDAIDDPDEQSLYIFLDEFGNVVNANYSGEL